MAKPATKIWCPKCHKRHRLPPNAGGMTLRCRGCKFAFRVQDGLTSDPGPAIDLIPDEEVGSVSAKRSKTSQKVQSVVPAQVAAAADVQETIDTPINLDHDYDDILDVLETPDEDPLAPPRALSKRRSAVSVAPVSDPDLPQSGVREPVTRQQLRAHRNSRQFWMMMSCLVACLLAAVSWFAVNLFMSPTLSQWERKMLFAMGAPARWLPPQEGEEEELLPPNHVGLRGDHVELADRNNFFRDEFPAHVPDGAVPGDRDEDFGDKQPGNRPNNVGRNGHGIVQPKGRELVQPQNMFAGDAGRNRVPPGGRRVNPPRNNRNGAANRNARMANNAWKPPALSPSDIQLVATRGIDPKMLKVFTIDTDHKMNVALADDVVFSLGRGNRISVFNIKENRVVANRKLDKEVAAICTAVHNEITNRSAVWILYQSGKLEKWELRGAELSRGAVVSLRPVFKEDHASVAAGKRSIAYHLQGEIIIANILETASKIDSTIGCPIEGEILALRFSPDDAQLMAIVDDEAVLIDTAKGTVISRNNLPALFANQGDADARSLSISADLSTLFVCRAGVIDSLQLVDGSGAGQYWASIPLPLRGVVADQDKLLGLTGGSPSQATMFSITEMVPSDASKQPDGNLTEKATAHGDLLGDKVALPVEGRQPFLLDRSPVFAAPIQAIQSLSENRIAILTNEQNGNRISIASWKNGWEVVSLDLEPGTRINKFAISDDLSKLAIVNRDVIQGWKITDLAKGRVEFVSESVGHVVEITEIAMTEDGEQMVSGDVSGKVFAWDFDSGERSGSVVGFNTRIKNIVTRSKSGFVAMDQKGVAKGSAMSNREKIKPFSQTIHGATALSDNGNRIAFFLGVNVNVADVSSQKVVGSFKPKERPGSIQFSRDQRYLLLQSPREIVLWDWRQDRRERVYRISTSSAGNELGSFDRSVDGETIAVVTGNKKNEISIFELPVASKE